MLNTESNRIAIIDTNVVNVVNDVVNTILDTFKSNPRSTIKEVAKMAGVTSRAMECGSFSERRKQSLPYLLTMLLKKRYVSDG